MTSPVSQHPVSLSYSGGLLDRAAGRRADPSWIAALLDDTGARLIPIWQDHCLVSGDPPRPVISADPARHAILLEAAAPPVFLGLDGPVSVFAADLSGLPEESAVQAADAEGVLDVRRLFGTVEPTEAATLAYARGLLHWNRHQQFCGTCGSPTQPRDGGHIRACEREDCARLHFPRIEPAVIMLVESAEPPRRCLLARHRSSAAGGYSTLAGFVEIGESLEDAVRREVAEETGVRVGPVTYVASQAWPFPAGLMAGFLARAESDAVRVDGDEILAARWFTEAELAHSEAAGRPFGRPDSIDRYLLSRWLAGSANSVPSALAT